MAQADKLLVDLTRGTIVCDQLRVADRARPRMRGLLGRSSLPPGEGLLLAPAPSIHTAFMRFPIDAVFLDGTLQVRKVVEDLRPWRMSSAPHAWAVLEIAAGEAAARGLAVGHQLGVVEIEDRLTAVLTALSTGNHTPLSALGATELTVEHPGPLTPDPHEGVLRVLLISSDRRFRSVAAALLTRRGCEVVTSDGGGELAELAVRERVAVAVVDIGHSPAEAPGLVVRFGTLRPPVGLVIVGERAQPDEPVPTLLKWDSFERVYAAVEDARRAGSSRLANA
jgi:uncharacterized membrane protein (UPF0127 family)